MSAPRSRSRTPSPLSSRAPSIRILPPPTPHQAHPFESSPLLGARNPPGAGPGPLKSQWGSLARQLERVGSSGYVPGMAGGGGGDGEGGGEGESAARINHEHRHKSLTKTIRTRSTYYIPVLEWLPNYPLSLFPSDLISGLTCACLIIPQSMSYASSLAHLPPVAGLYSAGMAGLAYALLGTCRQLSVAPEAALSLLVGKLITDVVGADIHGSPGEDEVQEIGRAVSTMVSLQVGMITLVLGIMRLGFLDVVLSKALLRGFITAVGIIIMIEQLIPMLGLLRLLPPTVTTPLSKALFICQNLRQANPYVVTMSFAALFVLIGARVGKARVAEGMRRRGGEPGPWGWVRFVPEILVVVVVSVLVTAYWRLDQKGVLVLGKIETGGDFPLGIPFVPANLKYFDRTISTSAVIAVVGYVDSVVAAKEMASRFSYAISPNRELVAQGAANLATAFVTVTGSIPSFGSITRTRLVAQVGGRSQMSIVVTSVTVLMTASFLLPYFYYLPKAVLSSIIATVVYGILKEAPHELMFYWKLGAWTEFLQACMTFLFTLCFNVEFGLVTSAFFSLILVIQKSTQTRIKIIGRIPDTDEWIPVDETPEGVELEEEEMAGVLVVRIRENLSFANTGSLKERLRRLELYGHSGTHPSEAPLRSHANIIVFHMNDVEEIDASALSIFLELATAYSERGVGLYFVHLRTTQKKLFDAVGISELLGPTHFQPDIRSAMKCIEDLGYGESSYHSEDAV